MIFLGSDTCFHWRIQRGGTWGRNSQINTRLSHFGCYSIIQINNLEEIVKRHSNVCFRGGQDGTLVHVDLLRYTYNEAETKLLCDSYKRPPLIG